MAYWIIEDKGFGGCYYRCSSCGEVYIDIFDDVYKWDCCPECNEFIDDDKNEYIEEVKKESNSIIFPQTIGDITFYSKKELFDWVILQQQKLKTEILNGDK